MREKGILNQKKKKEIEEAEGGIWVGRRQPIGREEEGGAPFVTQLWEGQVKHAPRGPVAPWMPMYIQRAICMYSIRGSRSDHPAGATSIQAELSLSLAQKNKNTHRWGIRTIVIDHKSRKNSSHGTAEATAPFPSWLVTADLGNN